MVVIQTELGARGGACQSWAVGEFHGKGEVGFGGDFFSRLSYPQAWVSVLAGSGQGLHQVKGAPSKPVTRGCVEMLPLTPTPTVQVKIVSKEKCPRD